MSDITIFRFQDGVSVPSAVATFTGVAPTIIVGSQAQNITVPVATASLTVTPPSTGSLNDPQIVQPSAIVVSLGATPSYTPTLSSGTADNWTLVTDHPDLICNFSTGQLQGTLTKKGYYSCALTANKSGGNPHTVYFLVIVGATSPEIAGVNPIRDISGAVTQSAPIVLTSNYTATQSMIFPKQAFVIAANNITIDLNGHTIWYNSSGTNGTSTGGIYGVHNHVDTWTSDDAMLTTQPTVGTKNNTGAIIKNGFILPATTLGGKYSAAVGGYRTNTMTVQDCVLMGGTGNETQALFSRWSGPPTISRCVCISGSTDYDNRHAIPSLINAENTRVNVLDSILWGQNSGVFGGANTDVFRCVIRQNMTVTNGYAVVTYATNNVDMIDCVVIPQDGRGYLLNGATGTDPATTDCDITNNVIVALNKPNLEFTNNLQAAPVRMRYRFDACTVTGNKMYAIGGGAYRDAMGLFIGQTINNYGVNTTDISNNSFYAMGTDNGTTYPGDATAAFYGANGHKGVNIHDNTFTSNDFLVASNYYDGFNTFQRFVNDTFAFADGNSQLASLITDVEAKLDTLTTIKTTRLLAAWKNYMWQLAKAQYTTAMANKGLKAQKIILDAMLNPGGNEVQFADCTLPVAFTLSQVTPVNGNYTQSGARKFSIGSGSYTKLSEFGRVLGNAGETYVQTVFPYGTLAEPVVFNQPAVQLIQSGNSINFTPTVTRGTGLTWSARQRTGTGTYDLASKGLSLNTSTGQITGTPTLDKHQFYLRASNGTYTHQRLVVIHVYNSTQNITNASGPFTLSTANRLYTLTENITRNDVGLTISAANVAVNMNGFHLTYNNIAHPTFTDQGMEDKAGSWEDDPSFTAPSCTQYTGTDVRKRWASGNSFKFTKSAGTLSVERLRTIQRISLTAGQQYYLAGMTWSSKSSNPNSVSSVLNLKRVSTGASAFATYYSTFNRGMQRFGAVITVPETGNDYALGVGVNGLQLEADGTEWFIDHATIGQTLIYGIYVNNVTKATITSTAGRSNITDAAPVDAGFENIGVYFNSSDNHTIDNCHVTTKSDRGYCVRARFSNSAGIINCELTQMATVCGNRDQHYGDAVHCNAAYLCVSNTTIHDAPQGCIFTGGVNQIKVYGCTLSQTARYTNGFSVVIEGFDCDVIGNTIDLNSGNHGGRGIMFNSAGSNNICAYNTIHGREMPINSEYSGCITNGHYAIQFDDSSNVEVYGNDIYVYGTQCDAQAIRFSSSYGVGINIHDNRFTARKSGTRYAGVMSYYRGYRTPAQPVYIWQNNISDTDSVFFMNTYGTPVGGNITLHGHWQYTNNGFSDVSYNGHDSNWYTADNTTWYRGNITLTGTHQDAGTVTKLNGVWSELNGVAKPSGERGSITDSTTLVS